MMIRNSVLSVCVLAALYAPVAAYAQARAPQQVIAATARYEEFVDRIEALGTLRANETVVLMATVTERVTEVNFTDGQRVKQGDILVEMTSNEEAAELDAEQATVEEARRQVERLEPLVKSGAAAQSLLDERRRNYETARARLLGIQSRISDRLVVAPFAGVVGMRHISVGTLLQPGTRITTLDDDTVMKLDFAVPSVFLPALKTGMDITAHTEAYPDRAFKGRLESVDSQVDPETRSIMARALLPNDERVLRPGLLMSAELLKNPRQALVIPEGALVPLARQNFVFVVTREGETARVSRHAVKIGQRRPGAVEILEGLRAGDVVVTHGTMTLADGAPVVVRAMAQGGETLGELLQQNGQGADAADSGAGSGTDAEGRL